MNIWQNNLINTLINIKNINEDDVFRCISNAAKVLDFEFVAYGLRLPLPISNPKFITLNSFPPSWQKRYTEQNYTKIDPTLAHGLHSSEALIWNDSVFKNTPQLWREAREEGLNFGWSQSSIDALGFTGILSLVRSSPEITDAELAMKSAQMHWLVCIAHLALSRILIPKFQAQTAPKLTHRETEVLKWTADGKTAEDIGEILNISANTVNFHIKNIMLKLNSYNKTSAVLNAAMLGLLHKIDH